jgi:hypothetical protein
MEQIGPVEALERGVHLFATMGMPARDFVPRSRLGQSQCRIRLSIG